MPSTAIFAPSASREQNFLYSLYDVTSGGAVTLVYWPHSQNSLAGNKLEKFRSFVVVIIVCKN